MNRIEITKFLELKFPRQLAYDWDNVGLQVGSLNKPVKRVLITLDVTKAVIREAIDAKVDMLISHHPLIFQPIANVQFDTPRGWMIKELVKHDIALYSMHTNFDVADGGMNDVLAAKLGLKDPQLLDDELGIGRFGTIEPMSIDAFIVHVKDKLSLDNVRLIGGEGKTITTVGISGGSGQQHLYQAKKKGCDVYLTGDVSYHNALDVIQMGFALIDIGHHAEKVFC
ncbi:MAG: Nif3-like dinuclear metal center hexameric protein, partial [Bacilli bacterium]|nr:Nif3-like dinuclear metal center hexameric protein [Bacilli bacterium]